jgi:hypothetical protein
MAVFVFLEGWYNPPRPQAGLDYLTPISYEQPHRPTHGAKAARHPRNRGHSTTQVG